jgi:uncharacterized protein YjbI with pentapeptide repeats
MLWHANLQGVVLFGADLQDAQLWNANLQGAYLHRANVTPEQLLEAKSLKGAIMPDGTKYEQWIKQYESVPIAQADEPAPEA